GQAAVRAPRPPASPSGIGRRDRSAYRVATAQPAEDRQAVLAPHLVRLTGEWALWRTVCLRAAGFPVHLLAALGDAALARAADAVLATGTVTAADVADVADVVDVAGAVTATGAAGAPAPSDPSARSEASAAYSAEFTAAVQRLSAVLHEAAGLPALRDAVAWQNRHALMTGIDTLRRHGP